MPISKSNGAVTSAPVVGKAEVLLSSTLETAPAPVSSGLGKRVLETVKAEENRKEYKGRDYDAEARGKVACASFGDALKSPGIAGLGFTNYDEYMSYVRRAADEMVKYTWEHQK